MPIQNLPYKTELVEPVKFDVSIYPVRRLVTASGVQYEAEITNATTTYADLFSISTHTWFPYVKGLLAWVYVNISFELKGGSATPSAVYILEAKNSDVSAWTPLSAATTTATTTSSVGYHLEGYILLTASAIDYAPFDIRLQFKSNSADANKEVLLKLKNDTIIRLVGSREVR